MQRYLAFVWQPHDVRSARTLQALHANAASMGKQWSVACDGPGMCVLHRSQRRNTAQVHTLHDGGGVVIGKLFDRGRADYTSAHPAVFDSAVTRKIVTSGGHHLIEGYWGAYVAFIRDHDAGKFQVVRDPTGNVPCYHVRHDGVDLIFSHVEDCVRFLPLSFTVDQAYLVRWLVFPRLISPSTGLQNVAELPPGERLNLAAQSVTRTTLWDPAHLAHAGHPVDDPEDAAKQLRSTVQNCVDAWASCYGHITHKLSGGLDSSIVAGCLARAPSRPKVTYLNVSIDMDLHRERLHVPGLDPRIADKLSAIAGHGDERHFARLVAQRWSVPLIERQRMVDMNLRRLSDIPAGVRPSQYFTSMEMDDAELELIESHGAEAFFSGQVGDSILLATMQPLPAMDYAYRHGFGPDLWRHLQETALLSRESFWTVLRKTLRHGLLRRPYSSPASVLQQASLLRDDLRATVMEQDFASHVTRLASYSRLPPGKQNHVRGVASPSFYEFVFRGGDYADHVDPLNSQPIWELMLRIPTYTILAGGVSRGLARRAFADLLPPEIRKRQVKGSGGPFYQHVVRRNKEYLREHLLDGRLVSEGYLDRRKVEECLRAEDPSVTVSATMLLSYLSAEIWLRQLSGTRMNTTVPESAAAGTAAAK